VALPGPVDGGWRAGRPASGSMGWGTVNAGRPARVPPHIIGMPEMVAVRKKFSLDLWARRPGDVPSSGFDDSQVSLDSVIGHIDEGRHGDRGRLRTSRPFLAANNTNP